MHCDAFDLAAFYASPLGRYARERIGQRLSAWWPDLHGQTLLGMGFATPYMDAWQDAKLSMAAMPPEQGAIAWPQQGPSRVFICDDSALPLADCSVDRILMIHSLEHAEFPRTMLREAWRVLASGGRLTLVVPSRTGIWARSDRTPFGFGSPFSATQLHDLLRSTLFVPDHEDRALFMPPFHGKIVQGTAPLWDRLGPRWLHPLAGVLMVEASKQLYAPTAEPASSQQKKLRLMPAGR
ncbi:MAG TPA: methyltransferase type 11 [Rhodospirillaceae bacterium]|nr:MAG: hypothetical protein A2018_01115 [Alphaproteobacteria bacterium GWF2_58_20]HAU29758.1 methyltransferase type 11 [Rhodospirillaceae bacterium]